MLELGKMLSTFLLEHKLALLIALLGKSSWMGGSGWGYSHWKDATSRWTEGRKTLRRIEN